MNLGPVLASRIERSRHTLFRALLLALLCFAGAAQAHQVNLSTARIDVSPERTVSIEVALKGSDVDRSVGVGVYDAGTDSVGPAKVEEAQARIATYILDNIDVSAADGAPCHAEEPEVMPDGDGVVIHVVFDCRAVGGGLVYRSTVLLTVEPGARQIVLIGSDDGSEQALLDSTQTSVTITEPAPALRSTLWRYLVSGIDHIFLGYDHIAFLVAVVLWANRTWPVVKAVTAFTIAHSITLSLAALGIVTIPNALVEAAIAASIVFVAVENFFSRNVDRRWWITFPFGLIHGLGFASALQAFGLPRGAVVPALAAFNIGVEIGQIAIVLIVVPTLLALDRLLAPDHGTTGRPRFLVFALSGTIAALAFRWLLLRTLLA